MKLPESISALTGSRPFSVDSVGLSGSQVVCFDDMILKIEPTCHNADNEQRMMAWLSERLPVPEILAFERQDGFNYLLMSRMPGRMLCSEDILSDGERITALMAEAYQLLWAADITGCPGDASLESKLRLAEQRVAAGLCSTREAEPGTYGPGGFASPEHLCHWLQDNKPAEHPVLSHGDFCLPNIFTDGQHITGFIDLGRSGAADRYVDIAIGSRSLRHNLDGHYSDQVYPDVDPARLYDALGIVPDPELIRYYILLDELF